MKCKYIRTKDRIIPEQDEYLQALDIEQYSMYMHSLLDKGDTIDDLCDGYIFISEDGVVKYYGTKAFYDTFKPIITKAETVAVYAVIVIFDKNGNPMAKSVAKRVGQKEWELL